MKRLLIPLIAAFALPNTVDASLTFTRKDSSEWCEYKKPTHTFLNEPKGSPCFEFIEINQYKIFIRPFPYNTVLL